MCVLFGSVNINVKRVLNLVRNTGLCFMQLLANFSPTKEAQRQGRVIAGRGEPLQGQSR